MTERDWKTVVGNVRTGQCVLLLGSEAFAAGGGDDGRPSRRQKLIRRLAAQIEAERRVAASTLNGIAQQYCDVFDRSSLVDDVAAFYSQGDEAPADFYMSLASLPFPMVITSGHDRDMERALVARNKPPDVARYHFRTTDNPSPAIPPTPTRPSLYYLHGSLSEKESLVLTDAELIESLVNLIKGNIPFPQKLKNYLKRRETSFLFIGFGLRHWYLRLLLHTLEVNREILSMALEPLGGLGSTDRDDLAFFYRQGHKIIVDDADPAGFVADLLRRVEAEGGLTIAPVVPGARPQVFISYASEDRSDAQRLEKALTIGGFDTWLDRVRLEGGDRWDDKIKDAIEHSDYIVVLQSPRLLAKVDSYVNQEIDWGVDRARKVRAPFKCLIPFTLEASEWHPALKEFQSLAIAGEFEDSVRALQSLVRRDLQARERDRMQAR